MDALHCSTDLQDDASQLLCAALQCPGLSGLDIRGVPLTAVAVSAATKLLQQSAVQTLLATVASSEAQQSLRDAAALSGREVQLTVASTDNASQQAEPSSAHGGATATLARSDGPDAQQGQASVPSVHERSRSHGMLPTVHGALPRGPSGLSDRRTSASGSQASSLGVSRRQPYPNLASDTPSLKPRVSTLPAKLQGRSHAAGISAGGAADRAAAAFLRADTEGSGKISSAKVAAALHDLGLLANLPPKQVCNRGALRQTFSCRHSAQQTAGCKPRRCLLTPQSPSQISSICR